MHSNTELLYTNTETPYGAYIAYVAGYCDYGSLHAPQSLGLVNYSYQLLPVSNAAQSIHCWCCCMFISS